MSVLKKKNYNIIPNVKFIHKMNYLHGRHTFTLIYTDIHTLNTYSKYIG